MGGRVFQRQQRISPLARAIHFAWRGDHDKPHIVGLRSTWVPTLQPEALRLPTPPRDLRHVAH